MESTYYTGNNWDRAKHRSGLPDPQKVVCMKWLSIHVVFDRFLSNFVYVHWYHCVQMGWLYNRCPRKIKYDFRWIEIERYLPIQGPELSSAFNYSRNCLNM